MNQVLGMCINVDVYVYVFMHDIVFLSTYSYDIHCMSLYDVFLPYMHNVCLTDYTMKVLLGMHVVDYSIMVGA